MKTFLKSLLIAAAVSLSGAATAAAGDVNLTITNASGKRIYLEAASCNGCSTSSTQSIAPNGSGTSSAASNYGVSYMTYITDYSARFESPFGSFLVEKGCRARITVAVNSNGDITSVIAHGWVPYASNATCTQLSTPRIDNQGNVNWSVRYYAADS